MNACEITDVTGHESSVNIARKILNTRQLEGLSLRDKVKTDTGAIGTVQRFTSGYYGNSADVEIKLTRITITKSLAICWLERIENEQ